MMKKTALITGSSRGLGLAIAKTLSCAGYTIILTGRNQNELIQAQKTLANADQHILICGDLLLEKTIQQLKDLYLIPDIIVHSLGCKILDDEQPLKYDILMQSIALNLGVAVNINAHFLPLMAERKQGRIIHIGSDASETGNAAPGYVSAKAAINAYVKSTARFFAKENVMICAVLPGIFLSPGNAWDVKRETEPEKYQQKLSAMPLGRFLFLEEVVEAIKNIALATGMSYAGSMIRITGGC